MYLEQWKLLPHSSESKKSRSILIVLVLSETVSYFVDNRSLCVFYMAKEGLLCFFLLETIDCHVVSQDWLQILSCWD